MYCNRLHFYYSTYFLKYNMILKFSDELKACIDYYNNKRIKSKLKGLNPIQYRIQSLGIA
ncbi:MAG: IS3 family transposase [Clostridia bacterium]